MCDEGVELVGRVLVLVSESRQANADAIGDVSETIKRPELTTQFNVAEQCPQSCHNGYSSRKSFKQNVPGARCAESYV